MQVFKVFLKVMKKNIRSMMIYVVIFLALSITYTMMDDGNKTFDDYALKVCVFDEDGTEESKALEDFVFSRHERTEVKNDHDSITDALYYGAISGTDCVFVINKGYADKLSAGDTDDLFTFYTMHGSYFEALLETQLNAYVRSVTAFTSSGFELDEAISRTAEAVSAQTEVVMTERDNGDPEFSKSFSVFFIYMAYILMAVMINTLCPVLMAMERRDVRYRTNCSSLSSLSISVQIFAGCAAVVLALWLVFMLTGVFLQGGMYHGKAWLAVLNSLVFTVVCTALALLFASFDLSLNMINLFAQVISLGLSFISGVFVQQSLLGEGVLSVARFFPTYWYVKANNCLSGMDTVQSVSGAMGCIGIEAAYAAALLLITLLVRRVRYSGASVKTEVKKAAAPTQA
ncbi:MAG TPA: ABC transporter permease [Ruminococcus sp.]|nr:ABC transporter permease [Ruminococcus sp.]